MPSAHPVGLWEFRARLTAIQEVGQDKDPGNKARVVICLRQRKRQALGKTMISVILTTARQVLGQNNGEGRGPTGYSPRTRPLGGQGDPQRAATLFVNEHPIENINNILQTYQ